MPVRIFVETLQDARGGIVQSPRLTQCVANGSVQRLWQTLQNVSGSWRWAALDRVWRLRLLAPSARAMGPAHSPIVQSITTTSQTSSEDCRILFSRHVTAPRKILR
jgi:hypothetical protein